MPNNTTISIREAISNAPLYCAQCHAAENEHSAQLLTCSRCKVALYCSRQCQRHHFALHKKGCKRISSAQQEADENENPVAFIELADTIVQVTYRSTHSLEFARGGLTMAIHSYLDALQIEYSSIQAHKVAFLLAAVNQDEAAISLLVYDTRRDDNDTEPMTTDCIPRIDRNDNVLELVPDNTEWNDTNLVTLLFVKMKLVASFGTKRRNGNAAKLATQQQQVNEIKARLSAELLEAIQECIPLTPTEAPSLFDQTTPFEYWCLLQDVFFLTPGVRQVLEGESDEDNDKNNDRNAH